MKKKYWKHGYLTCFYHRSRGNKLFFVIAYIHICFSFLVFQVYVYNSGIKTKYNVWEILFVNKYLKNQYKPVRYWLSFNNRTQIYKLLH